MKRSVMLTITSLLSILFFTFYFADDIVRGFEPGGFKNLSGVLTQLASRNRELRTSLYGGQTPI